MVWYENPLVWTFIKHFVSGRPPKRDDGLEEGEEVVALDEDWETPAQTYERGWFAGMQSRANEEGTPLLQGRLLGDAIHGRTMLVQLVESVRDDRKRRGVNGSHADSDVELCLVAAEHWLADTRIKEVPLVPVRSC